jgi:hypothetical protein
VIAFDTPGDLQRVVVVRQAESELRSTIGFVSAELAVFNSARGARYHWFACWLPLEEHLEANVLSALRRPARAGVAMFSGGLQSVRGMLVGRGKGGRFSAPWFMDLVVGQCAGGGRRFVFSNASILGAGFLSRVPSVYVHVVFCGVGRHRSYGGTALNTQFKQGSPCARLGWRLAPNVGALTRDVQDSSIGAKNVRGFAMQGRFFPERVMVCRVVDAAQAQNAIIEEALAAIPGTFR